MMYFIRSSSVVTCTGAHKTHGESGNGQVDGVNTDVFEEDEMGPLGAADIAALRRRLRLQVAGVVCEILATAGWSAGPGRRLATYTWTGTMFWKATMRQPSVWRSATAIA